MAKGSVPLALVFSSIGHAYVHAFTAFYFVIVLSLESDWQLPYHELIELWTLGSLLVGLGAIPAGWLGDRWSAPGMMVVYFLGLGAASMLCGFLSSPLAMLLGLAAIGLFGSIYHPVGIAWLLRNAKKKGKALGINGIFGGIGVSAAGLIAGALIDLFGWRAAFFVPGAVCFLTGLGLWLCWHLGWVEEGKRPSKAQPSNGGKGMARAFVILLFTMFATGLIFQMTQAAVPKVFDLRLRDLVGEGAFGIGAMVALVYFVAGLMQILGGLLADRYPLKPIYVGAFVLQVPVLLLLASFGGLPLIAVTALAVMLSNGGIPAENMLLARFAPERHQSLAFGIKFVLAFGSAPLAVQAVAFIKENTGEFTWVFTSLAILALVATVLAFMLPGERRQRQALAPAE